MLDLGQCGLEVLLIERIDDIEEELALNVRSALLWQIGQVLHDDLVAANLRQDLLHRQFVTEWNINILDLTDQEIPLNPPQDVLEEIHRAVPEAGKEELACASVRAT